jgi:glycosyltransferase involved in cell wall biosynthesis
MQKKLSILLPTYNRGHFLEECLKRLENRGFFNNDCEIIISDNCSNDNTQNIVKKYNVKYSRNISNLGYNANIEILIKKASGAFIIILGDDDEFLFDWNFIKNIIDSQDFDLYVFGFDKSIFNLENGSNKSIEALPFGFIGDCIQKNTDNFKNRFMNYKGKSNSAHFFARIDVLLVDNCKVFFFDKEMVKRFYIAVQPKNSVSFFKVVKQIFIKPLDYGYYWFEARRELKKYYPEKTAKFWTILIDKSMIYTRSKHISDSGIFAVLYYWFFQLYFRCFKYPAFSLWILKGIAISAMSKNNQNRFISYE